MDVMIWRSKQELTNALQHLSEQPGSYMESVFVQEWVDFDVEMRHFIVEPQIDNPQTWKPRKIIYTVFKTQDKGAFRNFDRFERKQCLQQTFNGDDAALTEAEHKAEDLIGRWLHWFQAQTSELP